MEYPSCPNCNGTYTYEDGTLFICPECGHEWSQHEMDLEKEANAVKDAYGNVLQDGDNAIMIKDVKIKGSSDSIKQGTKVSNIRLEVNGDHNITARVDGYGVMDLKSELVKKA
ncbi:alkylphosphonate utilization protein [Erysipelothrix larvae]|uniref:Alkylphosphonate utilization protein n=1 Tax=Erysipelothrix larvae TaxID=1514105 RepID=A0A120JTD4_9FIRM|nr:zinc ribbon domain-containing protein YjdM [Erysipelothrix larvae]AMC92565.1 alkylphosphonate utilization protein [Erysipelothrix larvae]